ncbi:MULTISPECIES: TetR/AcrR family transcriptional regulator [unclassified Curtobacterium]|uniref:TetR/AcrR family transcriptional regulator n=1 Tax=unclassified Curtobacterium TaxID=257496 RepID=UPI000DA79F9E|nr:MULTISPECIES: TetR/AcrR family transcriptional regulator [unclassified Curtobacterium]PZE27317.1 hypothetical protein DEI86_07475 [Curtobacterium sp. MCBD17_028]PZE76199.1 hypothetical protein DEI82_06835 [Curtobacterium sp. MCBD17_019]WIB67244.1 TetR/AcrR family transcriptional regulator [Curtobacterium sp. MCBD17_035]WIE54432.1 TetR/AcrR family transcriptional regulator [Curtobacterium sp. MCBD17_003]
MMLDHTNADTAAAAAAAQTLHLRVIIVDGAVDLLHEVPFHEARPEAVAARIGISLEELHQHFPSWDGLVLAAVDRWNGQRTEAIEHTLGDVSTVEFLRAMVASNVRQPALMRLLVALASVASDCTHPMAPYLQSRYQLFVTQIRRGLEHDVAVGRAPHTMDPRRGAEQLIALYEGLQLQALLRQDLDLMSAFDRAASRLERGWEERYQVRAPLTPSTWVDDAWSL